MLLPKNKQNYHLSSVFLSTLETPTISMYMESLQWKALRKHPDQMHLKWLSKFWMSDLFTLSVWVSLADLRRKLILYL